MSWLENEKKEKDEIQAKMKQFIDASSDMVWRNLDYLIATAWGPKETWDSTNKFNNYYGWWPLREEAYPEPITGGFLATWKTGRKCVSGEIPYGLGQRDIIREEYFGAELIFDKSGNPKGFSTADGKLTAGLSEDSLREALKRHFQSGPRSRDAKYIEDLYEKTT